GLLFSLISCQFKPEAEGTVSETLRQEAIDGLWWVMGSDFKWEKIHAAEYLLKLDYRSGIDSLFRLEEKKSGNEPYYRIGIWRVLAALYANEDQGEHWVDKIKKVYQDSLSQDRIHSMETLAKLGIPPDIKAGKNNSTLSILSSWAESYSSEANKERVIGDFVRIILSEDQTVRERKLAAYALRDIGGVAVVDWDRLVDKALNGNQASDISVYLNSLCWVTSPTDSVSSPRLTRVRDGFLQNPEAMGLVHQRELALTLAEKGDASHLPLLISMFNRTDGVQKKGFLDVHAAAAYAILRIDRRGEPALAWFDWVVIFLYGGLMLGIGWYYSKKNLTKEDYLLGGRKMNSITVGISLFATLLITLSYLSYPGEMIK